VSPAARPLLLLQLLALAADKQSRAVEDAPADGFCEGNPPTGYSFETALFLFYDGSAGRAFPILTRGSPLFAIPLRRRSRWGREFPLTAFKMAY